VTLDENRIAAPAEVSILEIDEALQALQKVDPRKHDMLELYYFAGLKMEDIAQAYAVTSKTVQRELRMAEAWLSTVLYTDENDT
jgi:RNA polymerase sigma factor (sigma-70 family)